MQLFTTVWQKPTHNWVCNHCKHLNWMHVCWVSLRKWQQHSQPVSVKLAKCGHKLRSQCSKCKNKQHLSLCKLKCKSLLLCRKWFKNLKQLWSLKMLNKLRQNLHRQMMLRSLNKSLTQLEKLSQIQRQTLIQHEKKMHSRSVSKQHFPT